MNTRLAHAAALFVFTLVGTGMAWWTWGSWPDVLIDFGREVFVPWQILAGKTLYTELWYVNGPLSPYWNALWLRLLGVGIRSLVLVNLALLGILTLLVHGLLRATSDRFSAAVATLVLLLVFGFGRYSDFGNYNFVTPYSHEITHGLLLSWAAAGCVYRYALRPGAGWMAGSGLCLGLVFLTKAEVFGAAAASTLGGLALLLRKKRPPRVRAIPHLSAFVLAALVPSSVAFGWLAAEMTTLEALRGVLGSWIHLRKVAGTTFYQVGLGTSELPANLVRMLVWTGGYAALLAPGLAVSCALPRGHRRARAACVALFLLSALSLLLLWEEIPWLQAGRPLPLFVLALAVLHALPLLRSGPRHSGRAEALLRVVLLLLAGSLLAKIAFNARLYHYGFALALPATLLVVVAGLGWIPVALDQRGRCGAAFRASVLGVLAVGVCAHLWIEADYLARLTHTVGRGGDAIRVEPRRGEVVGQVLEALEELPSGDATLAVLPEGVMLNYLSRRATPTPYYSFTPFDLALVDETTLLQALVEAAPERILLVHRETPEYGARTFGRDYARAIRAWLARRYRPVRLFGEPPFRPGTSFGVLQLERRRLELGGANRWSPVVRAEAARGGLPPGQHW